VGAASTGSEEEIAHFETLSASWWDPQGPMKPLHQMNPVRMAFIMQHMPLRGKKILDVGCGGGLLAEAMAQEDADVLGIDLGETLIQAAQHHAPDDLKLRYQKVDVAHLAEDPQQQARYDAVTCLELLEHVPDPQAIITACSALLKPGGLLFLSTINRSIKAFLFDIVAAEYLTGIIPKGTHRYERFLKPSEVAAMARQSALHTKDVQGLAYAILKDSFTLGGKPDPNYIMVCQK
jgi:2-polyprenyl-6-hydroxyphenyl methylase / 3-demethylubiquinone-9 3-methyltransferase